MNKLPKIETLARPSDTKVSNTPHRKDIKPTNYIQYIISHTVTGEVIKVYKSKVHAEKRESEKEFYIMTTVEIKESVEVTPTKPINFKSTLKVNKRKKNLAYDLKKLNNLALNNEQKFKALKFDLRLINGTYTSTTLQIHTNTTLKSKITKENKGLIFVAMNLVNNQFKSIGENNPTYNRVQKINALKHEYKNETYTELSDIVIAIKELNINIDLHLPKGTIKYIIECINNERMSKSVTKNKETLTTTIQTLRNEDKVANAQKVLDNA